MARVFFFLFNCDLDSFENIVSTQWHIAPVVLRNSRSTLVSNTMTNHASGLLDDNRSRIKRACFNAYDRRSKLWHVAAVRIPARNRIIQITLCVWCCKTRRTKAAGAGPAIFVHSTLFVCKRHALPANTNCRLDLLYNRRHCSQSVYDSCSLCAPTRTTKVGIIAILGMAHKHQLLRS